MKVLEKFEEIISCRIIERKGLNQVAFTTLDKKCPHQGRRLIDKFMSDQECSSIAVLIVLEDHEDVNDTSAVLWKVLNNIDPKRDMHYYEKRLGIDVTCKTGEDGYSQNWPDEIEMSREVRQTIDQKWKKMFNEL